LSAAQLAAHVPFTQLAEQQSAPPLHDEPCAAHAPIVQMCIVGSQLPEQHCPGVVHVCPSGRSVQPVPGASVPPPGPSCEPLCLCPHASAPARIAVKATTRNAYARRDPILGVSTTRARVAAIRHRNSEVLHSVHVIA
jgi:hypothetical protein